MEQIKQKQINRENLLNHGVALLMQQGYHGTGLKEILDAVQIPKGSFYNYFGSKENFAAEIIAHYIEPYVVKLQNYLAQYEGNALAALERYLQEAIAELEHTEFKGGCLLGNLTGEVGDTSDVCRAALRTALSRYRDVWEVGFSRAQSEGTIRTDKTARELADLWINAWQGALLRMKIEQSTAPLTQCYQELLGDFFKAR
ncbi:MAG: TetR family transcriptional regulator C-terminal domain-containing protein [Methylococcales bacterium]|nr:TetR family transcriptional regulator C-terminal domain-containing protein [Methylococcales bacterium]MDD5753518.1 TetR family transcriptional regulator C-terminal domain-containing protein [Methylococcales bacterium]